MDFLKSAPRRQQLIYAIVCFYFAFLAFKAPLKDVIVGKYVGGLLILTSILVFIQAFQRSSAYDRKSARMSALITFLIGLLYASALWFKDSGVIWLVVIFFSIDALLQWRIYSSKRKEGKPAIRNLLSVIANAAVAFALFFFRGEALQWLVAMAGALRIVGMGIEILSVKPGVPEEIGVDVIKALHLPDDPLVADIGKRIAQEEQQRAPIDRGWIISLLLLLFFMHLGRMGFDRSPSGILSPTIALIGDVVIALIISFFFIMPVRGSMRSATRFFDRSLWKWVLKVPTGQRPWYSIRNVLQAFLERRLRIFIRSRRSGYSLRTALRTGLQTGLPFAALLATIIPVFGMSWYFDTENWAAGIWDGWAASRTDIWRKAMVEAVEPNPTAGSFMLKPEGVGDTADFSFVVIGDPGEGDASQYVLHDQLVRVSDKPDVKFVVISSDVIYPDGAMKDYERNFWLAMHGVKKPVFAIPGNHDWYDALDGFAANFYTADAARKAMEARRKVDLKITSTTGPKIESMIGEAGRLRNEYQVPTGFQTAPFFQVQTKNFAFITIETGVLRRIDDLQMQWLKGTLEAAKGKFIFVLLGHPFYAIGEYQGNANADFTALHNLLKQYGANVAMAGDTHDLEYYEEPLPGADSSKKLYHFVNGGGGAYLSLGAALRPKDQMPEKVWAHYPAKEPFVKKIEDNTGWSKRWAWQWTKLYNGWPFSAEWLSAAFDYNVSPFFQSFVEVRVEPSKKQVRILAYNQNGPLTWTDLERSEGAKPAGAKDTEQVAWVIPMK